MVRGQLLHLLKQSFYKPSRLSSLNLVQQHHLTANLHAVSGLSDFGLWLVLCRLKGWRLRCKEFLTSTDGCCACWACQSASSCRTRCLREVIGAIFTFFFTTKLCTTSQLIAPASHAVRPSTYCKLRAGWLSNRHESFSPAISAAGLRPYTKKQMRLQTC